MDQPRIAQVTTTSDTINFGIGQPGLDLLPTDIMRRASAHRLAQEDPAILNYGAEQGDGYLRRELAAYLTGEYAVRVPEAELFITAGASQALDLICTLFTQPGDTIFVEEPSYFLALRIFEDHGLNVVGIPMDDEGLRIESLVAELNVRKPAFLYTIPTFQNPTGVTLSTARREQLAALADEHDFLVVADEVYHLLHYAGSPPPPLAQFAASGRVLSVGSFSKILAPGLRLGWIQAAPENVERFVRCGVVDSGGGLNPFTSSIVRSVLELGLQAEHLAMLRRTYAQRIDAMDAILRDFPASIAFARPAGGFFFWLTLPDRIDCDALLSEARAHKVGFQPGVRFSSNGGLHNCLRLSFAYYGTADLQDGLERLNKVFEGR